MLHISVTTLFNIIVYYYVILFYCNILLLHKTIICNILLLYVINNMLLLYIYVTDKINNRCILEYIFPKLQVYVQVVDYQHRKLK